MVSAAAGAMILSVTSAISLSEVQGIFITRTTIKVLLVLYDDFMVESTKNAILVFCNKSFPMGCKVMKSPA